jgi:hypothetical protein
MSFLFYRFYRAALFLRKGGDPEIRAWIVFSIAQGINLYTLQQLYYSMNSFDKKTIPDYIVILIGLAICVINYFLFLYKDRFKMITKKYDNESKSARIRGIIIGFVYVLVSISLAFYTKHLQFN